MLSTIIKRANYKHINIVSNILKRNKTYLSNNEWLSETKEKNVYKIGIDNYASEQLGDLVYIDFNVNNNDIVDKDDEIVYIESVKAVGTVCAPFDCKIIEINDDLEENFENINIDPECEKKSWILKLSKIN